MEDVKAKPTSHDPPREGDAGLTLQVHRCPFCHTDLAVASDDWVACRQCLARHHRACWSEGGRCSSCGDEHVLQVAPSSGDERVVSRSRPASTPVLLLHGVQGLGRLVVGLARLPLLVLRGLATVLGTFNAWPRATGLIVTVTLLLALLVVADQPRVVYRTHPVTQWQDPPQRSPRERAREAAASGQFEAARLELERLVERSPMDADLLSELGWARLASGLTSDARVAYDRARAIEPGSRRWGDVFARAALGDRQGALGLLDVQLSVNDPAYRALWRALLSGAPDAELAEVATRSTWQGALARWGQGKLDDETFLAAALDPTYRAPTRPQRLCEAHAYVALAADLRGDRARALEHYRAALDTRVFEYIEYVWASARLRALQGGGPTLGDVAPPAPTAGNVDLPPIEAEALEAIEAPASQAPADAPFPPVGTPR